MALGSLLLSFLAGALTFLGIVTVLIPGWGAVLAFLAPVCACVGVILGGMGLTRANRERRGRELPIVAISLNVLLLFPAFGVALTCGVCNAVGSTGPVEVHRSFQVQMAFPQSDGGLPPGFEPPPPLPRSADGGVPDADAEDAELQAPDGGSEELPPPPLPAGPVRRL